MERFFGLAERGSSVRIEIIAGITTFLTMAYIIVVNPGILSASGMPFEAVFVATCVAAAIGSLIMGLAANYPIALAPGMGLNAFFAFVVVGDMGLSWQAALAAVFISGVLFLILSVLPVREWIINAIPHSQKMAIAAGIGLFLAFIALRGAGVVVDHPATYVTAGDLTVWSTVLAIAGFFFMMALDYYRVPGAIIIGILAITAIGIVFAVPDMALPDGPVPALAGIVATPPDPSPTLFSLDFGALFDMGIALVLIVIFSFLLVDLFDTAGTLVGVAHQAGLLDREGRLPRLDRALLSDSSATIVGALAGTSTTTSYIESASGVRAGGRTGLTAVVVAILFLLALVFAPLAKSVPGYATAPAILFVGMLMARSLGDLDWSDMTDYVPALVTAIAMPLTFSIAIGIGFGFVTYVAMKVVTGRAGDVNPAMALVAAVFVLYFVVT